MADMLQLRTTTNNNPTPIKFGQLAIVDGSKTSVDNGLRLVVGNSANTVVELVGPSTFVSSFSGGTTGLTPNTATKGAITLGGTLAVANGGTGSTTTVQGGIVYGSSSSAYGTSALGTSGQVLISGGTGAPTWTSGLSVDTNGSVVISGANNNTPAMFVGSKTTSNIDTTSNTQNGGLWRDASDNRLRYVAGSSVKMIAFTDQIPSSQNVFTTVAVAGQSDVVADSSTDTLTLASGTGINLTTNQTTDTVTIATNATNANTSSTIVARDANGSFSANVVTASSITTGSTSFDLINSTATTVNFAGAAATLNLGAATGTTTVRNDLTVNGDFIVQGNTVTVNTSTLSVEDPLISLGKDNSANVVDLGFYGRYNSSGTKYAGLFRDADTNKFMLFHSLGTEPTTTVNTELTTTATLIADIEGSVTGTVNKVTITAPATSATLTIANGKTLTASNTLTFTGTDSSLVAFGTGGTVAYTSNKLNAFATTTSAELAGVINDETGSGALVFATSPTLVTPLLGTPTSGTLTNCSGLPISGIVASTSASLGVGTIELGHASDTTLARVSAGVVSIEGVNILTANSTVDGGTY